MFNKIDIGIKTFLRDPQLLVALTGATNMPGARLIVVDDGEQTDAKDLIYKNLRECGHIVDIQPFDSGFGVKSNTIARLSTRPYLLIASDDFDFTPEAAEGILDLQRVLDNDPTIDIASGRVNNNPYEFYFEISNLLFRPGFCVKEVPASPNQISSDPFWCDLTVNYSLIRSEVFHKVKWDDDVRIGGGEHGAFFYDCKLAKFKIVCVPSSNINEQKVRNTARYRQYRNRASSPERPCFDKRGIVEYILSDGRVDYRKEQ